MNIEGYTDNFGQIPKDEDGISYEIHHKDGNRLNNSIENLECVTIKDHYNIHLAQGDYYACICISKRMNMSDEDKQFLKECIIRSNKTREISDELRKKMSDGMRKAKTGWVPSEETRAIWSEQRKGKEAWNKGKTYKVPNYPKNRKSRGKCSEETIQKMSIARKKYHENKRKEKESGDS